jgi:hypothetical protein
VHTNEIYFRDTAHGFLAWSVATLLMATLLSSATAAVVTTGAKTSAVAGSAVAMAGSAAGAASSKDDVGDESVGYSVDSLFRANEPANASGAATPAADHTAEVTRIFANALRSGELPPADAQYLGQLVAARTGLSQADAQQRVSQTFNELQQTLQRAKDNAKKIADDARKASAGVALWLVVSLLVGAFVASYAATFGGRLRDSSVLADR